MILVENLVKRYGAFTAVDGVSLEVAPGEIHGFLGPNGAGKTTTIRILTTLLRPQQGRVEIFGLDAVRHPMRVRQLSYEVGALRTLLLGTSGNLAVDVAALVGSAIVAIAAASMLLGRLAR